MGVKSLWTLLTPVGRPVLLEAMEGKMVAIDSSIWIYQFQATMRAKDGRALVNAHLLGFLRRICKLLFYGMKPVFVFDGGAPVLKRETLNQRRKKKSGAAESHVKLAERLLNAQLRREALKHVNKASPIKGKGKAHTEPVELNDDTVYLEDIDPTIPTTPHRKEKKAKEPTSSGKKNRFIDHDPYRLPDIDMEARVASVTRSSAPDPRLATEEELRSFIENMRPEDFDVTSPAFRELPTEVQYEIVGDLRLKSRQTSHIRLEQMLQSSATPLDFSKHQIKNLKQRNSLTQQLLTTTDSIGKAHISIPVRIASERNREYMLIRNEGPTGGWILGVRDEGTRQKPIVIDHEEEKPRGSDSQNPEAENQEDDEMEEVDIPVEADVDSDLRHYRRQSALSAIARRYSPKHLAPLSTKAAEKAPQIPLFDLDEDNETGELPIQSPPGDFWEEDEELAFAIQESLEYSRKPSTSLNASESSSVNLEAAARQDASRSRSRLETALSIANTSPSRGSNNGSSTSFGRPFLLTTSNRKPPSVPLSPPKSVTHAGEAKISFPLPGQPNLFSPTRKTSSTVSPKPETYAMLSNNLNGNISVPGKVSLAKLSTPHLDTTPKKIPSVSFVEREAGENAEKKSSSDTSASWESVSVPFDNTSKRVPSVPLFQSEADEVISGLMETSDTDLPTTLLSDDDDKDMEEVAVPTFNADVEDETYEERQPSTSALEKVNPSVLEDQSAFSRPRSHSPEEEELPLDLNRSRPNTPPAEQEDWDAAHEMNPDAEEGDFAQFVSQVKGRDIDEVRREIDAEIVSLDQQRKNAMRDAEDVNQQMVTQIMTMLRLFGIPYITAPMEAEAQCAELLTLNLVDGIITDDSDVFLFGGQRVFKNMFNQSKTVECFLLSDLTRELGLDQGTLIRLAYLLGSDYVEGLPGVGPVVAMELLREFPGDDGLHKFKDWWLKVQSGKDNENENYSAFRKRFKKKFKDLYLPTDWPNAAVRDAYYHPTVDDSDEPFKWGLPDLDALRAFLNEELDWGQIKVDDLLLPIIQKVGKRGQANAVNRQGNLSDFFNVSGSGTVAPRKRQAYASKRLQQVVSDFRKKRKSAASEPSSGDDNNSEENQIDTAPSKKKPRTSKKGKEKASISEGSTRGNKVARGRRADRARSHTTRKNTESSGKDDNEFERGLEAEKTITPLGVSLRPRPQPKPIRRGSSNGSEED